MCLSVLLASFIYLKKTCLLWNVLRQTTQVSAPRRSLVCPVASARHHVGLTFEATHLVITHQPAWLFLEYFHCFPLHSDLRVNYLIRLQSTLGSLEKMCHVNIYK